MEGAVQNDGIHTCKIIMLHNIYAYDKEINKQVLGMNMLIK